MSNEMTPTKEDQIRAEFENINAKPRNVVWAGRYYGLANAYSDPHDCFVYQRMLEAHKACAESYEKKLAAEYMRGHADGLKGGEIVDCTGEIQHQLSEANARNAMLVEAGNAVIEKLGTQLRQGPNDFYMVTHEVIEVFGMVLDDNSESAAAWEAEKLEPLRRDVAMLRDALRNIMDSEAGALNMYCYLTAKQGLEHGEATAEAYEREVKAEALQAFGNDVLETVSHSDVDDHSFEDGKEAVAKYAINCAAELRANKVK